MFRWWQHVSVSRKLYAVVGVMAVLIATELGTLYFAMTTLSAVRAFVGGEGLWSKAQKTAVYHIQKYAGTHDEKDYQNFVAQLSVPVGDHAARLELEKPVYNLQKITEGFLAGQNHPQDVVPMVNLVRRFHAVPHLARAIEKWQEGDSLVTELINKGTQLHNEILAGANQNQIDSLVEDIFQLDDRLTRLETEFSFTLGEASRWLEHLLMGASDMRRHYRREHGRPTDSLLCSPFDSSSWRAEPSCGSGRPWRLHAKSSGSFS